MRSGHEKRGPPPLPDGEGRRLRAFHERAGPILAAHAGINAESQLKLRALAAELGLSDEEFQRAVSGPAGTEAAHAALTPEQQENLQRFSKNIVRSLRKQHRDVLTPQVMETLVAAGCTRYQLPEEVARGAVRQVAAEQGIRAISKAEARQYVADMVRQRVGDSPWIDHALRQRAYTEGRQWGLSRDEVSAVLSGYVTTARRRTWAERAMLALAMLALFAVGGLLAWIAVPRETVRAWVGDGEGPGDAPGGAAPDPAGPAPPPPPALSNQWWDVDLAVAIGRAHKSLPDFGPLLADMQLADEEKRGAAYEELVRRAAGLLDDKLAPRVLREVAAGCYALDPSDQAAARLRDALLAPVPRSGSDLPDSEAGYRPLLWTLGTAVAAVKRAGIGADRAEAMAVALGQAVGSAVDRTQQVADVTDQCVAAMLTRCYRLLAALAASEPALAHDRYQALSPLGAGFLAGDARLRLEADVLSALVAEPGERWRAYETQVREAVQSDDVASVLKMVDAYQRTPHPELRSLLRGLLVRRAGVRTTAADPEEVARAVREALGASIDPANLTVADRWRLLAVRASKALSESAAEPGPPEKLVEQSVRLAGFSTLAFALARRELGCVTYDQLSRGVFEWTPPEQPKPAPGRTPAPASGPASGPSVGHVPPAVLGDVYALTMSLKAFRRMDSDRRVFTLSSLRRYVGQIPDVAPEQGLTVAEYLLSSKPESEARKVAASLPELGRWRSVRLGLADELPGSQLSKERAVELVAEVLRRQIDLGREENWKGALRYLLLKDVLDELPQPGAGQGPTAGRLYEAAEEKVLEYQAAEAQLLGATAEEYRAAASPSARLRLLIDRLAAELSRKDLRSEDRAYLAGLAQQVAAAEYLGPSDLARFVLLDRVWLRLGTAQVAQQAPQRAAEADQIAAELARRDARAAGLLEQLRDGRRAVLETWLLLGDAR